MHTKLVFLVLAFFLIVTCSTLRNDPSIGRNVEKKRSTQTKLASIEARQVASEAESSFVAEIVFPQGKSTVPLEARQSIRKVFQAASKKGKVAAAKIITWGDRAYPSGQKELLGSDQRKLVEDRNDQLESYLERLDEKMDVDKISMAEQPGVMDEIMSGENVRLKKTLEDFREMKKISRSIVMFILQQAQE